MIDEYDFSWDKGNNEEAWDKKYNDWQERDWIDWLEKNLSFPFEVGRKEDEDDAYFSDVAKHESLNTKRH